MAVTFAKVLAVSHLFHRIGIIETIRLTALQQPLISVDPYLREKRKNCILSGFPNCELAGIRL